MVRLRHAKRALAMRRHRGWNTARQRTLRLEPLEQRQLLAVVTWDGGGEDLLWGNPLNWSEDQLPGFGDDVVIGDLPGEAAVQFSLGLSNADIRSLSIQQPLEVNSGDLFIDEHALLEADVRVFDGFLFMRDAVVNANLRVSGGKLFVDMGVLEGTGTLLIDSNGSLTLKDASLEIELTNLATSGDGLLVLGLETTFSGGFFNGPEALLSIEGDETLPALLTIDGGFVNEGFIDLASAGFGPTTIALVVEGGPLVNRGTITTFGDHADDLHLLLFDLVNEGFLDVLGDTTYTGQLTTTFDSVISVIATDTAPRPVLTFERGFVNEGVIALFDEATGTAEPVLRVVDGPLVNAADGQIISDIGDSDGPRRIEANIENIGALFVDQNLTVVGSLLNSGEVIASDVLLVDNFQQIGGSTILAGGALGSDSPINISAGVLSGEGFILGDLINNGVLRPGTDVEAGALIVSGNFQQTPAGRLEIDLGGVRPGLDFDQLTIQKSATLGGTLEVTLVDDFLPQVGDVFQLLVSTSPEGRFDSVSLPELGPLAQFGPPLQVFGYRLDVIPMDAPPPLVSIEGGQIAEGDDGVRRLEFLLRLSQPRDEVIVVELASSDGSALAGVDYVPIDTSVEIPAGQTSAIVRVDVLGDLIDENDETFTVTLTDAMGAEIDPDNRSAVGLIIDDDVALVSIFDVTLSEADNSADFEVKLSTPSSRPVRVDFTTIADTALADADFVPSTGHVVIPAGETGATVSVAIVDDLLDESNETFFLRLTDADEALLAEDARQAIGTIVDDDQASLSIDDAIAVEGNEGLTVAELTVRLSTAVDREVRVDFATSDETALAGRDYLATSGTLVFAPGQTELPVTISILGDRTQETRRRSLSVELTPAEGIAVTRDRGRVTIIDDDVEVDEDAPPTVLDFGGLADLIPITGLRVVGNTNPALFSSIEVDDIDLSITLTHAPDAFGQADVSVEVLDGDLVLASVDLSVSVSAVNDPPSAGEIDDVFAGSETSQITIDLLTVFSDVDDAIETLTLSTSASAADPLFSAVDLDAEARTLTLSFASGVAGRQAVSIRATDPGGEHATSVFTVGVDRAAPLIERFTLSAADDDQRGVRDDNTTFNPLPSIEISLRDAFADVFADGGTAGSTGGANLLSIVLDVAVGSPGEQRISTTLNVVNETTTTLIVPLERPLDDGRHVVDVRVVDAAGNATTGSLTITIDRQAPFVIGGSVRTLVDDTGLPRGLEFVVQFSEELFLAGPDGIVGSSKAIDNPQNLRLTDANGRLHEITSIEYRSGSGIGGGQITPPSAVITINPPAGLPEGDYELALLGSQITDRAGNFFGGSDPRFDFQFFTTPPSVEGVRALAPIGDALSRGVLVELSEADLVEAEAENVANYLLERLNSAGQRVETVPLTVADYNSLADRILLRGEQGLSAGSYRLTIFTEPEASNFIPPTGVTGISSLALDGDGDGLPGGRLVAVFTVDQASGSLELDRTAIEGNLQALDTTLRRILLQGGQSEAALTAVPLEQKLLTEIGLVLNELGDADSQTISAAVNVRIAEVFRAARDAEYLLRDFAAGEYIVVWGHDVGLVLRDDVGNTLFQSDSDRPDGLSLAVVPVRLAGELFSNKLLTRLDDVAVLPTLRYSIETTGLAEKNQGGLVYFGSGEESAEVNLADSPLETQVTPLDLSDVLLGLDPRLPAVTESVIANVRAVVGNALDSFLILWLDPVDFVLADSQGVTSRHVGDLNVDEAPGAIHVGNEFSELLVIPNAPADVYTLNLVGVGGEFRGEAIFVQGNSFRSAPLQGLLGSSDSLVAQIDFRNDRPEPTPFFAPPIFDVVAQNDAGGAVFAVADDPDVAVSSESSGETTAAGLADRVRGSGHRRKAVANWIEWLFEKLRRAIEEGEQVSEDDEAGDKDDDKDDENENQDEVLRASDPLGDAKYDDAPQPGVKIARRSLLSAAGNETFVDGATNERVNDEAKRRAEQPASWASVTDAAIEEMDASLGALLALGWTRGAASRIKGRPKNNFPVSPHSGERRPLGRR